MVEPVSADNATYVSSTHPGNTKAFLDALVSCGYLDKEDGLYRNSGLASAFLERSSATYLGDFLTGASQIVAGFLDDLPELIRHGPQYCLPEEKEDTGTQWTAMADATTRYSLSGKAQQIAGIVSRLHEFASFKKMLDLGDSAGDHAMAMVHSHPDMKAVIFDQPAVVDIAETTIKKFGFQERIKFIGGDFVHDAIGDDYDFIWTSATLNFCKADLDLVLKKTFSALNPGGVFACLQDGLTDERTQPKEIVLPMLSCVLTGNDIRFDRGEIADDMLQTGFRSIHSQTIKNTDGPMDLDIGRK